MTKKASANQALGVFMIGLLAFLGMRWGGFEPYVIPSGSMIPSLLIYDHILVSKFEYGLRLPFSDSWMIGPSVPKRGDVVVFRSVKDEDFFMVKRVIGLPGEKLSFHKDGSIEIDGQKLERTSVDFSQALEFYQNRFSATDLRVDPENSDFFKEQLSPDNSHLLQQDQVDDFPETFEVPDGHIFLMGDNRDSSQDSRVWGPLPITNLLGKARWIWLSCEEAISGQQILCNPKTIRWQRMFTSIQ